MQRQGDNIMFGITQSEIFKRAHIIAKKIRVNFKNYREAFTRALKDVYKSKTWGITEIFFLLGVKKWEKYDKSRYYINQWFFDKHMKNDVPAYKGYVQRGWFYDCDLNAFFTCETTATRSGYQNVPMLMLEEEQKGFFKKFFK